MTPAQTWVMILIAAARCVFILGILLCLLGIANCLTALAVDPGNLTAIRYALQYGATLIQLSVAQFLLKLIHHWFASEVIPTYWQQIRDAYVTAYNRVRERGDSE